MSGNWSQGGHYTGHQNFTNNYNAPPNPARGRPPICFTCNQEGHFVKDCPKQNSNAPVGLATPRVPQAVNSNGFSGTTQTKQWANGPNDQPNYKYAPAPGPKSAPISQFAGPGQNNQFNAPPAPAPYVAPNSYQQYPAPGPPQQNYQQGPPQGYSNYTQNQQYGPSAPNGSYHNQPPPQQYNAPPPPQQYNNQGYQAPYNQNPPPNPPQQYGPPTYPKHGQQYTPPVPPVPPFQPPTPQVNGYNQNYNNRGQPAPYQGLPTQSPHTPQWNGSPQSTSSFQPPPHQQQGSQQSNPSFNREFNRSQSHQPQRTGSQQSQGRPAIEPVPVSRSQIAKVNAALMSNGPLTQTTYQSYPPSTTDISRTSSPATTPYASPSQNNISEWSGQPDIPKKDSDRSEEEKQFNWDFKNIFHEDTETHETVALAQPLANKFDMTPVPLIDKKSTITISRYARRENLKEYMQSVRKTPQWPYLQEDPAFFDSSLEGPLVPLNAVHAWMESRHGSAYVRIENRKATSTIVSRKRKASEDDEQADIDQQLQSEVSMSQKKRQKTGSNHFTSNGNQPSSPAGNTGTTDDIWAPQPGEGADPTEALLAALGVSGDPKPVEPGPPVMVPAEHFQQPIYNHSYNPQYQNQPFRQDSGYVSAHGSYGPPPMFNAHTHIPIPPPPPPVQQEPVHDPWPVHTISTTPPPPDHTIPDDNSTNGNEGNEENPQDESPLSPTSMEILGKLTKSPVKPEKPRKIVRVISGKNRKEPQRQVDDTTPRFKRSQPVVDEAYSRRW